jgi:RNA-directed DNA polymerase
MSNKQERGLALSPEKTRITPINEGFDFLGQDVRSAVKKKFGIRQPSKRLFFCRNRCVII